MKCANGCGELVELGKPTEIMTDPELYGYIPTFDRDEAAEQCIFCTQILRICPKCGYAEIRELTEAEWNRAREGGVNA